MTDILSKALVQPKIIPPTHSDQISEPMMSEFMDDSIGKRKQSFIRDLILEEIKIIESDKTSILHSSPLVLMSEDLIILGKRIFIAKIFLKEIHSLNR